MSSLDFQSPNCESTLFSTYWAIALLTPAEWLTLLGIVKWLPCMEDLKPEDTSRWGKYVEWGNGGSETSPFGEFSSIQTSPEEEREPSSTEDCVSKTLGRRENRAQWGLPLGGSG